jgi:hypothetical protein
MEGAGAAGAGDAGAVRTGTIRRRRGAAGTADLEPPGSGPELVG